MLTATWEKEGAGRYVGHNNDGRIGMVIGGEDAWQAELPSGDVLGHFKTRREAQAELDEYASNPVWLALKSVVEDRTVPFLRYYTEDFYKLDRNALRAWRGAVDFLFILRPMGTSLIPLDTEWHRREIKATLEAYDPKLTGQDREIYWVRARSQGGALVKRVADQDLAALLAKPALYGVHDMSLIQQYPGRSSEVLADLRITDAAGPGNFRPSPVLDWTFRSEPTSGLVRLAISAGFADTIRRAQSLFVTPKDIRVTFNGRVLASWERQQTD